jgi:DNA-binding beta-propeller fold protein YncE
VENESRAVMLYSLAGFAVNSVSCLWTKEKEMKKVLMMCSLLFLSLTPKVRAQTAQPLKLVANTPLPGFTGDFDHFTVDLKGKRLFLTAEDHKTVEVFDLDGKRIHSITGFATPHALLFLPDTNRLIVTDGDETVGAVELVNGEDYKILDKIKLPNDVDGAIFNPVDKNYYVESGGAESGGKTHLINIIDPKNFKLVGSITLPGDHSEAMAIDREGKKFYVNLSTTKEVGVVDLKTRKLIAQWPIPNAEVPNALVLDEPSRRLFIATRKPAKFFVYDIDSGKVITSVDCADMNDDMWFDVARKRIYVTGTETLSILEQRDADHYTRVMDIPTGYRAKTSLLVPELNRLYVAVSGKGKPGALMAVQVYDLQP